MTDKKPKQPSRSAANEHYAKVTQLIESAKTDSITQFGEIKKEFGAIGSRLDRHDNRLSKLEEDKIKRDAIEEYKKSNGKGTSQPAYNNNDGSITVNKELLTALKYLGLVVAALAAAILAMKVKP